MIFYVFRVSFCVRRFGRRSFCFRLSFRFFCIGFLRIFLRVVGLREDGFTSFFRVVFGRVSWGKVRLLGVRRRVFILGLVLGWGFGSVNSGDVIGFDFK